MWGDAGADGAVGLEVDFLQLSVVGDDGAAEVLAGVELDAFRVVPLCVVAVDALSVLLVSVNHVAVDEAFVEVLQTTLVERQVLVGDIAG